MSIELRRAPGTCCPEPTCDYVREKEYTECESCGSSCSECKKPPKGGEDKTQRPK